MERTDFVAILSPLVVTMRAQFDQPTWGAYYRALSDVPSSLLAAAVDRAVKSARFMPKPGELREWAEEARQKAIQALGAPGCAMCEDSKGFVSVTGSDGITRMERCGCFKRLQEKRAELAVGDQPLAIAAAPESDVA